MRDSWLHQYFQTWHFSFFLFIIWDTGKNRFLLQPLCQRQRYEPDACGVPGRKMPMWFLLHCLVITNGGGGSRQCVPLIEKASLNMYQSLAWLRMWNSTVTFMQRWTEAWLKCQLWQERILSLSARAWAAHLNALFWKLLGRVFQKKAFKVYTSILKNLLNLDEICSCFLNGSHRPLLVLLSFWSSLDTTHPVLRQPLCGQYMRVLVHLFLSVGLALKLHF